MRLTTFLLIFLVTISALFELDAVLGAFAAGFILRYIIPDGSKSLEMKLEGVGYGFLIPVFFVVSGAAINVRAVAGRPALLVAFIVMLMLIRAVPVYVALSLDKRENPLSSHHRVTVALYCTTALPIIVAVTSLAVKVGTMQSDTASTLVAAGAITVFLMPLLGSITYQVADVHPVTAVREICAHAIRLADDRTRTCAGACAAAPSGPAQAYGGNVGRTGDDGNDGTWRCGTWQRRMR